MHLRLKHFIRFHELSKQYGPIVGLKFGPQNVVVLNHYQPVKEYVVPNFWLALVGIRLTIL